MLDPNRIKDYISLVRTYNGENDYMLSLKSRVNNSGSFNPTPKQIEYIQKNYRKKPMVVEKEISVSSYFATKLQEQHRLVFLPKKFTIVKILANGEDTLHVMVKFTEKQTHPTMLWIPKKFIIKEKIKNKINNIDFSKFSNRPPMVHQKEAVKKLLEYDRFILSDDMGLGKTTSAVLAAMISNSKKILIICPSSLKLNWKKEIEHYDSGVGIVSGKKWVDDEKWTIINYDILKNFHSLPTKNKTISKRENSTILDTRFDLVIIDEAHGIKNTSSKRTKLVMDFVKDIKRVWLLTGTPVANRPIDFYNLLRVCRSYVSQDWIHFVKRYCEGKQFRGQGGRLVWDTKGASNLQELHQYTKDSILRRKKEDILDLPPKIVSPVYHQLQNATGYQEIMGEYKSWTLKHGHASLAEHMTKLVTLRKFLALEKTNTTIEFTKDLVDQDKKVIIFTNFNDEQQKLVDAFPGKCVRHNGSMNLEQKEESVERFQNDPKIKVFIGNIISAGVGITLTSGEVVIMNSLDWVPKSHSQAEDRAYRIGQDKKVNVYYPIFDKTIEEIIYKSLKSKQKNIDTIMGEYSEDDVVHSLIEQMRFI
jgi:SWI/SNF-related matrix-associated actin-dependent regulator 1 of chromatin subfamily A|tara:strand:+ start:6903 stop:8672 length:1770 start_codon:yes stop_codon:yes gene_type:complete